METSLDPLHKRIRRIALGDVLHRSARRFGERVALIDGEQRISFRELDESANRFAHHLLGMGAKSGERIGMLCVNSIEMVIAIMGIHKAGLVWVPINNALAPATIGYILDHTDVRHLVLDVKFHANPDLRELAASRGIGMILSSPPGSPAAPEVASTVSQAIADGCVTLPEIAIDSEQLVLIMYTSGTTGNPKGVMHSHASVYSAMATGALEWGTLPNGNDVWSGLLPLFHIGQYSALMISITVGSTMLVQRGFDAETMLDAVERHQVTVLFALPMMYAAMFAHANRPKRNLNSLRLCIYGMAPFSKSLLKQLLDEFCPNFAQASGQTEVFTPATIFEPHQQRQRSGPYWGVGTLVNEVAVMGEDGRLLPPGEVGEIVYRGPNVMLGYYKDPEATAHVWRHGWHHSGDLGMFDADGQLLFVDRLKDMIKSGGENVPSIKVEETLLRHPALSNAAVVGLPHDRWGEAITAFVVLRPSSVATADEVVAHCKGLLGGFEVPKDVVFVPALPMTSTGKILKFELRRANLGHYETS